MHACLIPMEEPAITVPRSMTADVTIQVATVITRNHAGTTHRQLGTTSQHRGITTSRGFINRHHAITSRNEATIGPIRIKVGMAITVAVGTAVTAVETTTIAAAMADATTVAEGATITVAVITMAEAATGSPHKNLYKIAAHQAPLFFALRQASLVGS